MKNRKEYIIEKAFEVFLARGYDSSSMTILHKELEMSRGAMYRYFPSKDDLFNAIVDKHIFGLIDEIRPSLPNENITLKERIEEKYIRLENIARRLDKRGNIETNFLNYTALFIQAGKTYPDFIEKIKQIKGNSLKEWEQALIISRDKGEIKPDVDIKKLSAIFSRIINISDEVSKTNINFTKGVKVDKEIVDYIYSLIKN